MDIPTGTSRMAGAVAATHPGEQGRMDPLDPLLAAVCVQVCTESQKPPETQAYLLQSDFVL